jgi:hypothetical protein
VEQVAGALALVMAEEYKALGQVCPTHDSAYYLRRISVLETLSAQEFPILYVGASTIPLDAC